MSYDAERNFWSQAFSLRGSITPRVLVRVAIFVGLATTVTATAGRFDFVPRLPIAPYEAAGAVLGILLVMRSNAGYDRWWEARKLWGGIVNQSRNLAIIAVTYGAGEVWRTRVVRLAALFPHVVRCSLRRRPCPEVERLADPETARRIVAGRHPALTVAQEVAGELHAAVVDDRLDRFAFQQAERERAALVDYLGACERILKTPLPTVYAIKTRRFLLLFLASLPFALWEKAGDFTPLIVGLVAYSLLALDQIGVELEDPFDTDRLSHLPLDDICRTIEGNVLDLSATAKRREDAAAPTNAPVDASSPTNGCAAPNLA